jgi:hypothetical protein
MKLLVVFNFFWYSVSPIRSFVSSVMVDFFNGLPILPRQIQNWQRTGLISIMGDCWLGLKASKFPLFPLLLTVSNDIKFSISPAFSVSSLIIPFRVPSRMKVLPVCFASVFYSCYEVAHLLTISFYFFIIFWPLALLSLFFRPPTLH